MGLIANYMTADDETVDKMMEMDDEGLIETLEELEETNSLYSVDKLWDGIHFLLTGVSAAEPIEGDPLSEAIAGMHVFNDSEDAEFIGCTEYGELEDIISALERLDLKKLHDGFDPKKFHKAEIYPNIWGEDREELWSELSDALAGLIEFYKEAERSKMNVIVSIY